MPPSPAADSCRWRPSDHTLWTNPPPPMDPPNLPVAPPTTPKTPPPTRILKTKSPTPQKQQPRLDSHFSCKHTHLPKPPDINSDSRSSPYPDSTPGHRIGLAVVIATAYNGQMLFGHSDTFGGFQIQVQLDCTCRPPPTADTEMEKRA